MRELNWNDLRFVLAVSRAESYASAARRLGVNESTVARRIAGAEQRLGVRLFERNLGVIHPTQAGATVVTAAERIELEVQSLETAVAGIDRLAAGSVRVTSVPIIVNHLLVPALPSLLREQPQLQIELVAEPRDLSLTKREADVALRLARPSKEVRAVARRIGQLDYAVYGPADPSPESLPWITYEDNMADLPQALWIAEQTGSPPGAPARLAVNDAEAILQGVKAGLGKSLLPVVIAEREPNLVHIGGDAVALSRELWLMVHPELRKLTRIRVVMDWLVSIVG